MSGISKQFQRINLQIIKIYKIQRHPIISICLDHQEGNERLYFGTCEEPSNRLLSFHDLNLFVNKAYYFVHRSTQEVFQGLIPIMYYAFYRNQFTNMTFLGPIGISDFIVSTSYILGVRNLAFGALDLNKYMQLPESKQKYGMGNKNQFLDVLRSQKFDFKATLQGINELIKSNTSQYIIPKQLINSNGHIEGGYFNVVPLFGQNQLVLQYLVLFRVETQIDYDQIRKRGISLARIPDIKEGKYLVNGKPVQFDSIRKFNSQLLQQAILLLDFKKISEITDFTENILPKMKEELQRYRDLFHSDILYKGQEQTLIIVHYADQEILQLAEYKELIAQFSKLSVKLTHIITSQEYYQQLDKESQTELGREQFGYYFLDYLKSMKGCLPKLYDGQESINQFKVDQSLTNIKDLWPETVKYLPMRMKTMQIAKGELFFENLNLKRSICFSLSNDLRLHLQRLHNIMKYKKSESYEITFLGTASSIETQSRNASCIYLNIKENGMLLDCGQNSLSQFYFSCKDEADFKKKISAIKMIYISHFHNDHSQGLFDFVKKRCSLSQEPFFLLLPRPLFSWSDQALRRMFAEEFGHSNYTDIIKMVLTESLVQQQENYEMPKLHSKFNINVLENDEAPEVNYQVNIDNTMNKKEFAECMEQLGVKVDVELTFHCTYSTAIKLTIDGKVIVYSSDRMGRLIKKLTRFSKFGQDADILIHECTYPDEMVNKANEVRHSTFLQALFTGFFLKSKTLVLTHFTERSLFYMKGFIEPNGTIDRIALTKILRQTDISPESYNIDELINFFENNVIFANDFMKMGEWNPKEIPQISRVILKVLMP